MTQEIDSLLAQFEAMRQDADALLWPLSSAQLLWKPNPSLWSIAECLEHLIIVDGLDLPNLRSAIAEGRQKGITGAGPFHYGRLSGWFVSSMEPPVKSRKGRAPKRYVPQQPIDPLKTVAQFVRIQSEISEVIKSADGLHLGRLKVPLPVAPIIKMSLGRRFQLLAAHDRRHLWQARQVLQAQPT